MHFKIGQGVEISGYLNKVKRGDSVNWVSEDLNSILKGIYLGYNVVKSGEWHQNKEFETGATDSVFVINDSITCHMVQVIKDDNTRYLKPLYVMEDHILPILKEEI